MAVNIKFPQKIVIDASVILSFLLPDESERGLSELFRRSNKGEIKIMVPEIFYFEVGNSLKSAVLAKRISSTLARKLLKEGLEFIIDEIKISWLKTLDISLKYKLSFYDASYLSLAKQEKIPLYSLDKKLTKLL